MQNATAGEDKRKQDLSFVRQVVVAVIVIAGCAVYPLMVFASKEIVTAFIAGVLMSIINVLAGYAAITYSFDRSYTTFLKMVLGGMGVRMAVMLGMLVVLIELFHFHAVALAISLLGCYSTFLVMEVLFIQKKLNHKIQR
jgi:hypothetical protein